MKLLFGKDGGIPEKEIKEVLPVIDADLKFAKIKPDIITATNEMIRLLGKEFYDTICEAYNNGENENEHLIYCVRYPILIKAYSLFAPNNDIAHTPNGRKMRNDEDEKLPFQWMLDSDNEAWQKRYYRALDDMLQYLDENEEWRTSEAYKNANALFIRTTDEFDRYFTIESRYILIKLMPGIRQCEQREIRSRIGKTRFDALKIATEPLSDADEILLELIREACVFYAMAWAMTRLNISIFPEGVLQAYTSDRDTTKIKRPAQKLEATAAEKAFRSDAEEVFLRIEDFIKPAPPEPMPGTVQKLDEPKFNEGYNFLSL
jgi:hypothetical protein